MLYWWFPHRIDGIGATKEQLVLVAVAVVFALEILRLKRGALVFPMRENERARIGGHVWLVAGCALAFLAFEQRFAMITILGTTLADPLIGEMREHGHPRAAPVAGFAVWLAQAAACVVLVPLDTPWALVALGAAVAVTAESVDIPHVDDNFTMNLVPLLAMTAAAAFVA